MNLKLNKKSIFSFRDIVAKTMAFVYFTHNVSKNRMKRKEEFFSLHSVDPIHTHRTDHRTNTVESSSEKIAAQTCKFNRIVQIRKPKTNENVVQFLTPLLCALSAFLI